MDTALEQYLEEIAVSVARQQGLQFSDAKDAQNHISRSKKEIQLQLQRGNAAVIEGLKALREKNYGHVHGYVSDMCGKLLKRLDSSKKVKATIEEIFHYNRSLRYFTEAVKSFLNSDDFEKEFNVIAVLTTLFPFNAQPYICLGDHLWRKEGIAAAATFYTQMIELVKDPALLYFAADCFYKNGDQQKSKEVIHLAIDLAEQAGDLDAKEFLLEFLRKAK